MAVVPLLGVLFTCTSSVRIESRPPGLDVYINGQPRGTSPVQVELSDYVGNNYSVELRSKSGEVVYRGLLDKDLRIGRFLYGFFLLYIPWFWVYGPKEYYVLEASVATPTVAGREPGPARASAFNDTVMLKNGVRITGVKVAITSDSLVLTYPDARTVVLRKTEIDSVQRGQ